MLIRCIREGCWDLVCFYPFFSWYPSNSCVFFCFLKSALLCLFPDLVILHIFVSSSETQWEVAFVFDLRFSLEILLQLLKAKKPFPVLRNWMCLSNFDLIPPKLCLWDCVLGVVRWVLRCTVSAVTGTQGCLGVWMHRPMSHALKSHEEDYK